MNELKSVIRIFNTDLNGKKSVKYAICGIKGVNIRIGKVIAKNAGIDPEKKLGYLSENEIDRLKEAIEAIDANSPEWMLNRRKSFFTGGNKHILGPDLMLTLMEDINMMKKIRSYKGIRHERGLRVRGQRTKSTGRKSPVIGVSKKRR